MVIDYSQTINRFTHLDAYPLPRIDEQINSIAKAKYYSTVNLKSAYYQVPLAEKDREYTAFEPNGKLYQYFSTADCNSKRSVYVSAHC